MGKHSKGPWKLEGIYDGDKESHIYSKSQNINEPVCTIPHDDITEDGFEEVLANAALIVAAPDMLKALRFAEIRMKDTNDFNPVGVGPSPILQMVRAAIKKATVQP